MKLEMHILANHPARRAPAKVDPVRCDHASWHSTDGDAIRCCRCLSQLVMVPYQPGEFRLEWIAPPEPPRQSLPCAA